MSRQLLLILSFSGLIVSSGPATAGWAKIDGINDENGKLETVIYVDPDTMRRTGHLVKVSILMNMRNPMSWSPGYKYLSTILDTEFDCRKRQVRTLRFAAYSGRMGRGTARFNKDAYPSFDQKWSRMDDEGNANLDPVFKHACAAGKR